MSEEKETYKAHCPTCDGERTCEIYAHIKKGWEWSDHYGHSHCGGDDHSLLECRGCETVFYEKSSWDSEDVDHWYDAEGNTQWKLVYQKSTYPKPESRSKPTWFSGLVKSDDQLANILYEMYVAYDNQSFVLTAIGLRTALDRGTEVLGIDPALTFDRKLMALKDGGWIGDTEKEILGVVTDAGNAAAHRGWQPDKQMIDQLLAAMEVFLQRAFILGKDALKIKGSIPQKPARS